MNIWRFRDRCFFIAQKTIVFLLLFVLLFSDLQSFINLSFLPEVKTAEAATSNAIKIEHFDQDVTTDGSTFALTNDVGATTSAFIRMTTGTRKSSAGPTGSTANAAPDVGTVGLVLSDTATVTVKRATSTSVKVMGEVWRYEGPAGGGNEFIVRDRVAVTLTGLSQSVAIAGISNVNKVIPFVTGYTVNDTSIGNWNAATIAAHMDSSGNLIVSRNNSGTTATVYVDVVEFTGSQWNLCYGYSGAHDTAQETVTLNTAVDGQTGSTCDITDWGTATIIEATMEGDSVEKGLSDTLALVRPGTNTTSVVFDVQQQDTTARNDGTAWIHVLQNSSMVVNRASNADIAEGNGTYGTATWPTGAATSTSQDLLGLEWFTDTSGVGTAHMRGGLHAGITSVAIQYADGDLVASTDYDSTLQGNFTGDITFAATPSGVIYEAGGTGTGSFVGYNDAGDFIIRAGNGASVSPSDAARIVITTADYDFSGRTGTLTWNFYPSTDSVDLSFDDGSNGTVDYSTSTTATAAWANWSGGDDGYVGNSNGNVAGSEITAGYNFNGTITKVLFSQTQFLPSIQHWIHRSGNTVGVEYGVIDISSLNTVTTDVFVTATGTHATETDLPSTNIYSGGSFILAEQTSSRNVTSITITESGTVDASQGLNNIKLLYDLDTTAPYDCSSESYAGTEPQFGSTDTNGFSGANGVSSFSGSVAISTTQTMCVYPVYDITATSTDGDTVQLSIADPSTDISASGLPSIGPTSAVAPAGSTTLRNAEVTQTNYNWRNDDGSEVTATSIDGIENTPAIGFANGTTRRLRLGISAEGSTSTPATQYRLEYGQKVTTCSAVSSWIDVGTGGGGDWDIVNTANLTDGNDTTNIALQANGGITDPSGGTFLSANGGQKDTSSQTGNITFTSGQFTELEYALQPTVGAPQGNTYCFRVSDAGTALRNYTNYAEGTISSDIDVSASSSQAASISVGVTNQYIGGTFVIARPGSPTSRTLTDITITETGTVDAQANLANPTLFYDLDTTAPYDCTGESYGGLESSVAGSAFSGPNGTSTFTGLGISVKDTQAFCGYVVFDVSTGATNGETANIEITDPSSDVVVTGSTVGPSTFVSPTGVTTIAGPVLTQTHYHWRNDNGDETSDPTGASSATGGTEDTTFLNVPKDTTIRLRTQVSNEGTVTSQPVNYRLEYGTKTGLSCSDVGVWQQVGVGSAFATSASPFISDGNTTNLNTATSGAMTDENTTFVGTGALRETSSQSGPITLTSAQFTELEFSIEATQASGYATDYCFRVTDSGSPLPTYTNYAELTTRQKQDFYIQRGTNYVTGTGVTLTAGVDYTAPASTSSAFVRITTSQLTGAGNNTGGGTQNADDVTAYISDQSDITTSFTIGRPATAVSGTRVDWEIIEYIGLAGTDNEMIVRDVNTVSYLSAGTNATGTAVTGVTDDSDIVVFITGQTNESIVNTNYAAGESTSAWNSTTSQPVFTREATGAVSGVSYAVVEFTGLNWSIQRVEHHYTLDATTETESISAVSSLSTTFVHAQKRTGTVADNGLNDYGHEVWLSSIGAVSFYLNDTIEGNGTGDPTEHYSVAWVLENTQTGTGAMHVYRDVDSVDSSETVEPRTSNFSFNGTVSDLSNASLWISNISTGDGTAFPRTMLGAIATTTTQYEIFESDAGQTQNFRVAVIEWPVADTSIRQNYYRFYVDNDVLDPTDPWPLGASDLGENFSITGADDPLGEGDRVRVRMSLFVNNASLAAQTTSFKLQYGKQLTTCSAVSTWTDVGAPGSGAVWRGFTTSVADGTEVATSTPAPGTLNLSVSEVAGTYEDQNDSAVNPYLVDLGQDVEYDWTLEHNGATQLSDYCFRMVKSDGAVLDGYNNYPTIRTTGFTPIVGNWRWYDDENNETPSSPLASENTAPSGISNQNALKLRATAAEVEGAPGTNVKFALQFSQQADFSDGGTYVVSTTSCTANSLWCYVDGAGDDNQTISTTTLSDVDTCVLGVGTGCGIHNEAATTTSTHGQPSLSSQEYEFTLKNAGARVGAVYYFRLYDVTNDVSVAASSTYPSLAVEGANLTLNVAGLPVSTVTEGLTLDVSSASTSIGFGSLPFDTQQAAAQRITVSTNATEGYQILMFSDQNPTNSYGGDIPNVTGTNAAPTGWVSGCPVNQTGCVGYHAGDDLLMGGSPRFGPNDSYAQLSTTPQEIMYSSVPVNESHDIVYKIQVGKEQPAGVYTNTITYIAVPVF